MARPSVAEKDPVAIERGRRGMESRWGPPRRPNLGDLSPEGRRLVLALIEAQRAYEREQAKHSAA